MSADQHAAADLIAADYGLCPVCDHRKAIKRDGTMRAHTRSKWRPELRIVDRVPCKGAGRPPLEAAR